MGKGFSLKGHTGVKECLAFQTPNPLLLSGTLAFAGPHMHAHTQINTYTSCILRAESLCPSHQQAQVVVIDWIKRLKINACILAPCSSPPPPPYVEKLFHLSTGPWSFPHAETLEC